MWRRIGLSERQRRAALWVAAPLVILWLNFAIAQRLFHVEYSAYLESNQGQFIALARGVANHLGDLRWWPEWTCGLPFQNTYLPLVPVTAGLYSLVTGHSPALSFHQVTSAFFCLSPVLLYFMLWRMSKKPGASFLAAAFYSVFSPCALLPVFRVDLGSLWYSRRFQILARFGEGPHIAALAFLPMAILFLYLAITKRKLYQQILAGVFVAATVLSNAFGAVIIMAACAALLATGERGRFWKNALILAAIAVLSYCAIAPALPPSVVSAIRANSPLVDGDYRFTSRSLMGLIALAVGFAIICFAGWKARVPSHLRFFALFAWSMTGIVVLGTLAKVYVVPQPHRYQIAMDMSLCVFAVFAAAWILECAPRAVAIACVVIFVLALGVQGRRAIRYGRHFAKSTDITKTALYRVSQWMGQHYGGERVMVGGSYSFDFNNLTDTPQLHGGQDPMLPNRMMNIAVFTIYTGMNAGDRDGPAAVLWLKALGAHAVSVPGPHSEEYYRPFWNPRKFEGILPAVWHEGDDTIYSVPARSDSLAHVMAEQDVVHTPPIHGLDTPQLERFVAALENPAYPEPAFRWTTRHSADVRAVLKPGQVIATQITYHPGWHALVGGKEQPVWKDGLGLLSVKPACQGACEITLTYDGGSEWRAACALSAVAFLTVILLFAWNLRANSLRRKTVNIHHDGFKAAP
jgi:hypothetical protein